MLLDQRMGSFPPLFDRRRNSYRIYLQTFGPTAYLIIKSPVLVAMHFLSSFQRISNLYWILSKLQRHKKLCKRMVLKKRWQCHVIRRAVQPSSRTCLKLAKLRKRDFEQWKRRCKCSYKRHFTIKYATTNWPPISTLIHLTSLL